VISAGAGHRKELEIAAVNLEPSAEPPPIDRSARVSVKDVLVGVGFLLALAAFVLSLWNARQLRRFRSGRRGTGADQT
jgi:hypothetical protein